jgi:erythronate-4-phosphate dehydrogenase
MPSDELSADTVKHADVLLVRTLTRVDRAMLANSRISFVGSASIGVDHVDRDYLSARGIAFASAPGCNATSVAEYVIAALALVTRQQGRSMRGMSIGIVGAGNIGSRLAEKAAALDMQVRLNDPPLARASADPRYLSLAQVLDSDIVSLHVPLSQDGPDATYHLADEGFFRRLKKGCIMVNTSRGPVVDTPALIGAIRCGCVSAAVIDVWENEPDISRELLQLVAVGTAHIAGYSLDGRTNATAMLYGAVCAWLGREPDWDPAPLLPAPANPLLHLSSAGSAEEAVRNAILTSYNVAADAAQLRQALAMDAVAGAAHFDRLRNEYADRRDFSSVRIAGCGTAFEQLLRLGFQGA